MDLKNFREKYNLTQQEFADIIGVPRTTYQMWEYNWKKASNSNMIKIEKAMKKIESENAHIEKIINRMEAIKSYQKAQRLGAECYYEDDEYIPCNKLKYVLLFIILVLIFVVLY